MQAYEWIGRLLQQMHDFEQAIKAFKLLLQLAWVTNSADYETKAFNYLSKQYFYMQYIQKCRFY